MSSRPGAHVSRRRVRPRYGRIASGVSSLAVTSVALLGAAGVLPSSGAPAEAAARAVTEAEAGGTSSGAASREDPLHRSAYSGTSRSRAAPPAVIPSTALPADSGTGRRVVFDMGTQRVWLVEKGDRVRRTYLVSGSLTDNLRPGTYEVYSTSRHAVGIDDSGTMQFMVRFAHGQRAAIGFHDIPVDDGELVQTRGELGTPQSHGCIRQWRPDARALWRFAPVGTQVVVVA